MTIRKHLHLYFGQPHVSSPDELRESLWNSDITAAAYDGSLAYQGAILEQYKIYVEMADRISARRALANTFFLTLNTALFSVFGLVWKDPPHAPRGLLVLPLVIVLGLCLAWFWIVRSYRQLNAGKYAVIGALEQKLPASPYWRAEWKALGEDQDKARYWPLTHLEQWVPGLFAVAYVGAFVAAMLG
jgi:hypothetical protein